MSLLNPKVNRKQPFRVTRDGREICSSTPRGRAEYRERLKQMYVRDEGKCCLCGSMVSFQEATFEHKQGRGMGGAKRDDREKVNGIAHWSCNQAKGSIPFDAYMSLPLEQRLRNCRGAM